MGIKHEVTRKDKVRTIGKRNFATDVLKVEISGPERSYFSVPDVPGVFQSLTKDLTANEKDGVRDMVARYMQPSQSIIICVASGTNDLANQAAFDMASTYDLALKRTILSLAQNQEKHLNHGWFVVRNRSPEEIDQNISSQERQDRERLFFESAPWDKLPESRRGVQALKKFLADLLCKRIQEIFPTILETIKYRQTTASDELTDLGPPRKTMDEQRTYLTSFAEEFFYCTSEAIRGRYPSSTNNTLKIRKHIREANDVFAAKMRAEGHTVAFQLAPVQLVNGHNSDNPQPTSTSHPSLFASQEPVEGASFGLKLVFQHIYTFDPYEHFSPEEIRLSDYLQGQPKTTASATGGGFGGFGGSSTAFGSQTQSNHSLFSNSTSGFGQSTNTTGSLFCQQSSATTPSRPNKQSFSKTTAKSDTGVSPIYLWIQEEINSSRGTELQGTLNPDVLPALFHRQTAKWKDFATSHFSGIARTVGKALKLAVEMACKGDDVVAKRIQQQVRLKEKVAEARGLLKIRQRIDEILSRHLQTQDPMFEEQIRKARLARFAAALKRYQSLNRQGFGMEDQIMIDLRNVTALFDQVHMSNAQNLEDDIHDILESYYELALRDFIEFVNQHVVEAYLRDDDGPVRFFNATYVSTLSEESIEELGAEDANIISKRKELQETMERLNRAEEIALKYT
ncbi:MAG: hypothetical protein Q9169_004207 [Polycauliona sp. 2 TL-2023]